MFLSNILLHHENKKSNSMKVEYLQIDQINSVADLVSQLSKGAGFMGYYLSKGVAILKEIVKDKNCIKWLSFPAAIISTGMRSTIKDALKRRYFGYIVTTCGTPDHDIARSVKEHYCGEFT